MNRELVASMLGASLAFSLLCAGLSHRFAPFPSANSERASEDAFADGLADREFVPPLMGPGRWTSEWATFQFRHLPRGPATLEVRVRNHQNPVRILVGREQVGAIAVGDRSLDIDLSEIAGGSLRVDLMVKPFLARGGRRLGTWLDRVSVVHARTLLPPPSLLATFVVPALSIWIAALWAGVAAFPATVMTALASIVQTALLWPHGVLRSDYAFELAALLVVGAMASAALARAIKKPPSERSAWAFAAFLSALLVQGAAALHPLVVGLDAVFHGHNLVEVAYGGLFPTSFTQHKPPFEFPYGVSFYLLLSPFVWAGGELVTVVRIGAVVSALIGSVGLFWLLTRARFGAAASALAVILLQLVPWTFDVYSNGNYSNVFGQVAAGLFFVWWAGGKPGGWPVGAVAFVLGSLGHLSSLIFLATLVTCLALLEYRDLDRAGRLAIAVGVVASLLYYVNFFDLVIDQLPRLWEGGRSEGEGILAAIATQLRSALGGWGAPVMILAAFGFPRSSESFDRDLRAFWLSGGILALAAILTPAEVRYLYALVPPLAIAASAGVIRLWALGRTGRFVAFLLVTAQAVVGVRGIADALLYAWRI